MFVKYVDAWLWFEPLLESHRYGIARTAGALGEVGEYVTQAASTGGFDRENAHLTRSRVVLDEEAWDVLATRLDEMLELIDDLGRKPQCPR
jgi:hypothetical protein